MDSNNHKPEIERFETDTDRIVHRHLADENDVITDEDLRNVRISTDLPRPEETTVGAEAASLEEEEVDEKPFNRPVTPFDVVE